MPAATIVANVLHLTVNGTKITLNPTMSLQRHHYRYCGTAGALAVNSLLYASVTDANVITDATEVGTQMEALLNKDLRPQVLFGKELRCKSGRVYLFDNSALDPKGYPNHFFPTSGTSIWGSMTQDEFVAASAIRRVEEAINARPASARSQFLDGQKLHELQRQAGIANPVIAAYTAARVALNQVPKADANLKLVSARADIVGLARTF